MKNNLKQSVMALSLCLGLTAAGSSAVWAVEAGAGVNAKAGHGKACHKKFDGTKFEARKQKIEQELGLTETQRTKMKTIREGNKTRVQALHGQLQAKRKDLMQYMSSPNATEAGARARTQDVQAIEKQLSDLRIDTWFQMRQNMTPEQVQKMAELRAKHKAEHAARHPGGGRFNGSEGPKE